MRETPAKTPQSGIARPISCGMSIRPVIRLQFQQQRGVDQTVEARLVECSDKSCLLEVEGDLPVNMPVLMLGDLLGTGVDAVFRGRVADCAPSSDWTWRTRIDFAETLRSDQEKEKEREREKEREKLHAKRERLPLDDVEDYYELLQLSPNADAETIQRVYRVLAARYHPDNQETGNADAFRHVREAYTTLADVDRRAAYDADYQVRKKLRWKIFDQPSAAQGKQAERAKRQGILSFLYTKRMAAPEQPGVSIVELEDMLAIPREHLDFSLWFLKESGLVARTDSGKLSITLKGVMEAETQDIAREAERRADRLLNPARAAYA
jgi:DnaJ domain